MNADIAIEDYTGRCEVHDKRFIWGGYDGWGSDYMKCPVTGCTVAVWINRHERRKWEKNNDKTR